MERETCFGGHDREVAENCVAVCSGSSAGVSSEGGTEEELPEVAAVCGCSVVHFADVHSAQANCSLKFAEWNSEMLKNVTVEPSDEVVQGSVLFAVDCSAYVEGRWVDWDQWSCCYLC